VTLDADLVACGEGTGTTGAFSTGRTPVTNDAYAFFVAATGSAPPRHWVDSRPPGHLGNHPVVEVTRADAIGFCEWLSEEGGRQIRLPSSAEGLWAAQGPEGRTYPWGDSFEPGRCNSVEANIGTTTPVDAFPLGAGPFGALDMAGNVWEWCSDEDEDGWGVLRGGCWLDADWGVRSDRTLSADPRRATATVGFRVVASEVEILSGPSDR
jgi:formylglycine-generating enzyme required for sulfatase activity